MARLPFVPMLILGVAQSLGLSNVYSLLNNDAPDEEHRGAFISLNSIILRLGQVLGLLLMAVVVPLLGAYASYFGVALVADTFFVAFFFVR